MLNWLVHSFNVAESRMERTAFNMCVLTVSERVHPVTAITGGSDLETSPSSQAQMSCSLWPSHSLKGPSRIWRDPDVSSSFRHQFPVIHQCALISVYVHSCGSVIVFCARRENVDLLSIIPHEQAFLEGMVQQKQWALWLVNGWG